MMKTLTLRPETLKGTFCHGWLDSLAQAIYVCGADGKLVYFNDAAANLWGRRPALMKEKWCGAYRLLDLEQTASPMAESLRGGFALRHEELILERPDGSRMKVQENPTPIRTKNGAVVGAVNVIRPDGAANENEQIHNQVAMMVRCAAEAEAYRPGRRKTTVWRRRKSARTTGGIKGGLIGGLIICALLAVAFGCACFGLLKDLSWVRGEM